MSQLSDRAHYQAREAAERRLAEKSVQEKVAAIHRDMAARYNVLVIETDEARTRFASA